MPECTCHYNVPACPIHTQEDFNIQKESQSMPKYQPDTPENNRKAREEGQTVPIEDIVKVFIFVKEEDTDVPPQFMLDRMHKGDIKDSDIVICLDKNFDDLRPFARNAELEVLYENDRTSH